VVLGVVAEVMTLGEHLRDGGRPRRRRAPGEAGGGGQRQELATINGIAATSSPG
jgi:hypothetical protein